MDSAVGENCPKKRLTGPGYVHAARGDGLVEIDIAVANLDIEPASGVNADPSFKMNRSPLAAVIREWDEHPNFTTHTFGCSRVFHEVLLPTQLASSITPFFGR
jgi:hypothetical protein